MQAHTQDQKNKVNRKRHVSRRLKISIAAIIVILLIPVSYAGYIYSVSPAAIRNPKLEHAHFRIQILVDGEAEDFAQQKYQIGYAKDQCSADLPAQPFHFHDNRDQFMHLHWKSMTGGMMLKYYGWNLIGGMNNALGFRLDNPKDIKKVPTHGNYFPVIPKNAQFYIYTGDENGHTERSFNEFKSQSLEQFFGATSNSPATEQHKTSLLDKLLSKTYAHGSINDGDGDHGSETEQEKLVRINSLIGNVVIFAQKDKPTDQQIKERFSDLEPLSDSACGG